ncbi:MAG: cohesin domain-containing protein [Gammaproteobacteria bacterium]|jgi:hypothetical protein|nr:cohesin domain-containing protein [Gammaproteobacteria bacterium]MBU0772218.1 cohesin domain-containing protein [Gammaproteobacteria bacterium]MBU0855281.1 cohesin domain-containing protein [Gammaproteobacteria bacterium]MBU1848345.1 cohesin domain-containing protein [Gammaproteobacteria bacterium]
MKILSSLLFCCLLAAGSVQAQSLSVVPSSPVVAPGDTFSIDIVVTDLGDTAASTLGTYDLSVAFDPSLVKVFGITFGNGLDVFDLGSLFTVSSGFGTISLYELSFDSIDDLVALQPDAFTLATLTFKAISLGTTPFDVSVTAFGDAFGDSLPVTLTGSSVAVVPEPQTLALMLAGLGLIGFAARRNG